MTRHSPGPWILGNENNDCCDVDAGLTSISLDRSGQHEVGPVISREEMLANARLVAAAPDLLEAAERVFELETCDSDEPKAYRAWADLKAAIKKATGK